MKTCRCCRREYDAAGWAALPLVGYVGAVRSGGVLRAVELRNCPCTSTLGVEVELERPVAQVSP